MLRTNTLTQITRLSRRHFAIQRPNMLQGLSPLPRIHVPPSLTIQLTPVEEQICDLLDKFNTHLKETQNISNSCRIAGGWVRDKLLQSESDDIDIALSDMMGVPFATELQEFAQGLGIETGTLAVIKKNPEQSKHLEAATLKIFGLELDFVNLRSEEYASDSRIPTVRFGTPLEDALRRDITINAMFYNVHTREVDDLTEKGLDDLRNGIIQTPLPAQETFLDDPLRMLRCIRFASRFGFEIVPGVRDALKDSAIQAALASKVKKDRVGVELAKMMKGRDPFMAIELFHECGLYEAVFGDTESHTEFTPPSPASESLTAASMLHRLINPASSSVPLTTVHPIMLTAVKSDPTCTARLFLAAALTPYAQSTYQEKKKTLPTVSLILRDALRLGTQNHFLDGIPALFAAVPLLHNPDLSGLRFQVPSQRTAIGVLLRQKVVHNENTGSHWTSSLLFSLVQELVPCYDVALDQIDVAAANQIIDKYNNFVSRVEELDLLGAPEAKHLIDGRDVVKVLDAKPGPWTGQVMAQVMEWQLENPSGSREECISWLKEEHAAGRVEIGRASEPATKKLKTR